jgi:hypothetical protein
MSTAPTAGIPAGGRSAAQLPGGSTRTARVPESTIDRKAAFEANLELTRTAEHCRRALAIAKLVGEGVVVCPKCRKPAGPGKFKIHPDGGWKHFGAEGCSGDAVGVLQSIGIPTGDAVRVLLGMPTRAPIDIPDDLGDLANAFIGIKSRIHLDVLNGILVYGRKTGGVEAAQRFYGAWHIAPEVVESWGAVLITDPDLFAQRILERFGAARVIETGLFVPTDRGDPYCLVSAKFPIVEPHRHPATGDVLYLQLRGSTEQHGREKFISLKGAPRAAQIGCGLPAIETLPAGSDVYIVEGFKDGMAGATLGLNCYGIPGVDFRPPEKVCALLSRHTVWVTLDGDDAGIAGRDGRSVANADGSVRQTEGLVGYLRRHGVDARAKDIAGGLPMDVTDFLVATHASGKANADQVRCPCPTCVEFRAAHPDWFPPNGKPHA